MLEDKHGLGVGGIDRVKFDIKFMINFPFILAKYCFNCQILLIFG